MVCDVLFIAVESPYLILPFVSDAIVLGLLYFDFQLVQLVGEPRRSTCGGLKTALKVLVDIVFDVSIDNLGSPLPIRRLEVDVHQTAGRHSLHTQASKKRTKFRRRLHVCEVTGGKSIRGTGIARKTRLASESATANCAERQGLTGEDLGLGFDVIICIHHVVVGIGALEGKDIGVLAVNLDTSR